MDTRSQHLLFDGLCAREIAPGDVDQIKKIIEKNLTVVAKIEHKFSPQGETIVFILSESHFSLHTYPENNYISMDIYVCNQTTDLAKIVEEIKKEIPFKKSEQKILSRGTVGYSNSKE